MSRSKFYLYIVLAIVISQTTFCSKEPEMRDCEKNNYGKLILTNSFSESVDVDIDGKFQGTLGVGKTQNYILQAGYSYKIYAHETEYILFPDDYWNFDVSVTKCAEIKKNLVK